MNRSCLSLVLAICSASSCLAQQPVPQSPTAPSEPHLSASPLDVTKIEAGIRDSYYHPDDLSGMDCDVLVDWGEFFRQLHQSPASERLKVLEGITVKVHARRGKETVVDIAWANGELSTKESMESGLRQTLGGFFQTYWAFGGTSIAPTASDHARVDEKDGGGYVLQFSAGGSTLTEEVDSNYVLTKVNVISPVMKGSIEPHFSEASNDVPGHVRLMTAMDITQQIGTTNMNVHLAMDYQVVAGMHVPRHVSMGIGGAYAIPMEFVGCSVSKEITVAPPPK